MNGGFIEDCVDLELLTVVMVYVSFKTSTCAWVGGEMHCISRNGCTVLKVQPG